MTVTDWEVCSYQKWYPQFSDVTTESIIICIPEDVVTYLQSDKLVLPKEAIFKSEPTRAGNSDWDDCDGDTPELMQPSFPEFSKKLKDAINQLGGSVFIKLNWSAPTDAAWITTSKTLKCTNLEDVYLLLKSSEMIARDLSHKFKANYGGFCIILKRWQDIHPGSEFRCFVMKNKLVGITQRDSKLLYEHIDRVKFDIIKDIKDFFQEKIKDNFSLSKYIFDVIRITSDKVSVIDFSPFRANATNPILFGWDDLLKISNNRTAGEGDGIDGPELRYLGEEPGYQPNYYGVPYDVVDLCARQSQLSLMDYVSLEVRTQCQNEEYSSESGEEVQKV